MNPNCPELDEILTAARLQGLSDRQRLHAAECPTCADALLLEEILHAEGARARAASSPPPVAHVTARLRRRLEDERERRQRLVGLGLRVAAAALSALGVVAAGLWGLRFYGADVGGRAVSVLGNLSFASSEAAPAAVAQPAVQLAAGVLLTLTFLSYGLWSTWVEE